MSTTLSRAQQIMRAEAQLKASAYRLPLAVDDCDDLLTSAIRYLLLRTRRALPYGADAADDLREHLAGLVERVADELDG